mgnify:FL=1
MVQYTCDTCNYNTHKKTDYNRHIKSTKHLEKVKETNNIIPTTPDVSPTLAPVQADKKVYTCTICNNTFTRTSSLSRHKKTCIEGKLKDAEVEALKKELEQFKQKENEFKKQIDSYEKLLSSAIGPKNVTNYNYIQMNYPNAPVLAGKKSYANLLKTNKMKLVDLIIMYYEQNRLVTFIGDYLIKEYLHKEPEKQSLWTTDLARLTYIISQAHKKGSEWSYDKKGSKTKKIIIEPVLEYIRNELARYNEKNCESNETIVLKKMMTINNILPEIDGNILIEKINKYISPKFIVSQGESDMITID